MDFLSNIINSFGTPQVTWAMMFAILGYFGKTFIDYFVQKRKNVSDLQSKMGFEIEKEKENVNVSLLSQILPIKYSIADIRHKVFGHAWRRASEIVKPTKPKNKRAIDFSAYETGAIVLGLGEILAKLNTFRTYQYIRVQAQFSDVDLTKKIDEFEDLLSRFGIYRGYQHELALYALKESLSNLAEIIESKKQREKAPLFLVVSISLAEKFISDFINAWGKLISQKPDRKQPTLGESGMDLSEIVKTFQPIYKTLEPDIDIDLSLLQVNNETVEFLRALNNLDTELQKLYTKLDKATTRQNRA